MSEIPRSNDFQEAQSDSEKDRASELQQLLTSAPLTSNMMTRPLLRELLDFYTAGVRAGTHGDDLLWSMAGERNFDTICAHALMRILTTRIDKNPETTVRRKEVRAKILDEFKSIIREKKREQRSKE